MRAATTIILLAIAAPFAALPALAVPPGGGASSSEGGGGSSGGRGTFVDNSTIVNVQTNSATSARNGSEVNRGVQANQATIVNSTIANQSTGTVSADRSRVNTGVVIEKGASVQNATISSSGDANVSAVNSSVSAGGVEISGARNAKVNSNTQTDITARDSTVKALAVQGDVSNMRVDVQGSVEIDARSQNVEIGTVKAGGAPGAPGRPGAGGPMSVGPGNALTSIGNVTADSSTPKDISISTSSGSSVTREVKAQNLSRTYKGGPDPSGNVHSIVTKEEYDKAMEKGGSVGNVDLTDPSKRGASVHIMNK